MRSNYNGRSADRSSKKGYSAENYPERTVKIKKNKPLL